MVNPSLLKGFIFDFDGTLADTLPLCYESFRRAFEPYHGRLLSDEEIGATFGPSEEGSVRKLVPHAAEECLEAYYRHYSDLHSTVPEPFEGIHNLLTALKLGGYRLGIVTGKALRSLEISIKALRLQNYFEHLEPGCPDGPCKPQAIRSMLAEWDLEPSEVLCIGDSPGDVRAAHEVGAPSVGAAWVNPGHRVERLAPQNPDLLFTTFGEFVQWLRENGILTAQAV